MRLMSESSSSNSNASKNILSEEVKKLSKAELPRKVVKKSFINGKLVALVLASSTIGAVAWAYNQG